MELTNEDLKNIKGGQEVRVETLTEAELKVLKEKLLAGQQENKKG